MSETPKDPGISLWNQHGPWAALFLVTLLLLGAAIEWPRYQKRWAIRELARLGFVYELDDHLVRGPREKEYQLSDLSPVLPPWSYCSPDAFT